MIIETWKAASTGWRVDGLEIHAKTEPPWGNDPYNVTSLEDVRQAYAKEATRIVEAMLTHMPQGLTDAILAEMCRQKASLFVVPQGYNKAG